ncbi:hypothetical protein [Paraburkholderia terricola]|uniref:hypothetical protein n=1 Tax=Paraburkholderia terricola TaxID=169427 RepID=UPI002863C339|nr:hypothetical protein [Paraburkholderia terricola]MDR6485512.1 hypothetical protein [Paraburkholderia terricola]
MKSALCFFVRFMVFFVVFSPISTFATAPVDASRNERLRIDFLSVPDWIEINHIEEVPERLVIRLVREGGGEISISTFNQDGPAFPELASIFKNKVNGKQMLFAIVKWRYYLPGVDTEGDYYEVHAYEAKKNERGGIVFVENEKMSNFYGSGFDGKQEGEIVRFRFKDALSIRKSLIRNHESVN